VSTYELTDLLGSPNKSSSKPQTAMKPHTSANKFASFMAATDPERRRSLVRAAKQSVGKSFPPFYSALRGPAKRYGQGGWTDPSELCGLISKMSLRHGSKWLNIDSKVTADAARALIAIAPKVRDIEATFALPPAGTKAVLEFPELDVIANPDLVVLGVRAHAPLIGALRFYLAKESRYELGKRGSELVARLEYMWLVRSADGRRVPDPALCLVLECFQKRLTAAPDDPDLDKFIRKGAADFAHLWHRLDEKEAA
jgi:hypothetical protein